MRILFDKNVPVGVRRFLSKHEVHTVVEMQWPDQLENGELLRVAEDSEFDVLVTSGQKIRYQRRSNRAQARLGRSRNRRPDRPPCEATGPGTVKPWNLHRTGGVG